MELLELITLEVAQVQESLCQRSNVYNGTRVIIKAVTYLKTLTVWVKGFATLEFPIDVTAETVAKIILEKKRNFKTMETFNLHNEVPQDDVKPFDAFILKEYPDYRPKPYLLNAHDKRDFSWFYSQYQKSLSRSKNYYKA